MTTNTKSNPLYFRFHVCTSSIKVNEIHLEIVTTYDHDDKQLKYLTRIEDVHPVAGFSIIIRQYFHEWEGDDGTKGYRPNTCVDFGFLDQNIHYTWEAQKVVKLLSRIEKALSAARNEYGWNVVENPSYKVATIAKVLGIRESIERKDDAPSFFATDINEHYRHRSLASTNDHIESLIRTWTNEFKKDHVLV